MRSKTINKILFILWHMSLDLEKTFKSKINSFSNEEIKNIYDFLITWDINIILSYLENKNKDLKSIINIIKGKKWLRIIKSIQLKEKLENEKEKNNIEELILNI